MKLVGLFFVLGLGFEREEPEISLELENAIRCLIRTWIRRELPKRMNLKVRFPTESDLPPERRLESCTADLLASAGLPQDTYYVGGNRIWDAVSGWLEKTIQYDQFNQTLFPDQNDSNIFLSLNAFETPVHKSHFQIDRKTLKKFSDRNSRNATTKRNGHEYRLDYTELFLAHEQLYTEDNTNSMKTCLNSRRLGVHIYYS